MDNNKIRSEAYGQSVGLSIVDKFGMYLSVRRVKKYFKYLKKKDTSVLDLGCGYHAMLLKKLSPLISMGVGIDVAIHEDVKSINNLKIYEDSIENSLPKFSSNFFDCILMISVLEHINEPLFVLKECVRILKNGGILLINIPTWLGKEFLEISAFNFNLSPKLEVDDHKMYYDKRDLWPVLVRAGFKPSMIRMKYYKFGLNLFVSCKK